MDDKDRSLNKFARKFLKKLLRVYPNWYHYVAIEKEGDMTLRIPAPGDRELLALWILTRYSERITIAFGGGHVDLEDWHDRGEATDIPHRTSVL
ncbi:MAG: hypothetical protein H0T73_21145 [Ardenticatenales bacterium]|nr:hypothetical protein [Ardenticatenales bacterium]